MLSAKFYYLSVGKYEILIDKLIVFHNCFLKMNITINKKIEFLYKLNLKSNDFFFYKNYIFL